MLTSKVTNNTCKQHNRHKTELKIKPIKTIQTLVTNNSLAKEAQKRVITCANEHRNELLHAVKL